MWQLEGYQYDLTADLLTARLVWVGQAGKITAAERCDVGVPICQGLRRVIDETVRECSARL